MNTVQLAQRLLRHLRVKDIALLSGDDALHLLDAINSGIQQFYALAPSIYKQTTLSGTLRARASAAISVTSGSNVFTGWTAGAEQRGYTIRIDGDTQDNEIVADNGLLDDYTGSTGTKQAELWGDCLQLNTVIDRLTSEPRLETGEILYKDDRYRDFAGYNIITGARRGLVNKHIGRPERYWIDAVGQSQAGDPAFLFRVDTLPDRDYRVRIDCELAPKKVSFPDLTTPVTLPLDDALIESHILPLCSAGLTDSPLWQHAETRQIIYDRAASALHYIARLTPVISLPSNSVGTRHGY